MFAKMAKLAAMFRSESTSNSALSFDGHVSAADAARDDADYATAVEHYRSALKLKPSALHLSMQLGHMFKETGCYDDAEVEYRHVLAAQPKNEDVPLQLGHLFNLRDEVNVALEWYQRAIALAPENADIALHLQNVQSDGYRLRRHEIEALVANKQWSDAFTILKFLVDDDRQEQLVGIAANVAKEAGLFDDAERLYARYRARARSESPDQLVDAHLQSGHFAKAKGDLAGALSFYIAAKHAVRAQSSTVPIDEIEQEIRTTRLSLYPVFR